MTQTGGASITFGYVDHNDVYKISREWAGDYVASGPALPLVAHTFNMIDLAN